MYHSLEVPPFWVWLEDDYQVHQSPALTLLSAESTPVPLALVNRLLTEVKGDLLEIGQVDKT